MNNTALQIRQTDSTSLTELERLGAVLAKSGFFADTKDAAQACVKVMAGMELGFPAIASITGVYIVKGKVSLSANLMAAAIKRSGKYNYRVRQLDEAGCKIEFFEGDESLGVSSFTKKDAQDAGLVGDTWKKFFRNMAFARALSNGAKWYTPDIFGGPIYTPEELGMQTNEDGEVIEVQLEPARLEVLPAHMSEAAQDTHAAVAEMTRAYGPQPTKPAIVKEAPAGGAPSVTATEFWKSVRKWGVPEEESSNYAGAAANKEITWAEALNTLREMYG
jgi:hypothetical protein